MISAKLACLGRVKTKVFWNKGYEIIISVQTSSVKIYHETQIILQTLPKFCNSSTSISFFITSILSGFDQTFLRNTLGSSSIIGTGTRYGLKFYTSVDKGLELKVKRFWELIPTFLEVVGEKLIKKTQGSLLWIWLK